MGNNAFIIEYCTRCEKRTYRYDDGCCINCVYHKVKQRQMKLDDIDTKTIDEWAEEEIYSGEH